MALGDLGKTPQFVNFSGTRVTPRRTDGTLVTIGLSPYPPLLFQHVADGNWEHAIRLCRFVKDKPLWACLAAMAINGKELNAAEVAYAAIDEVDKVQFILHIKEIPTSEGRNAEIALFRRRRVFVGRPNITATATATATAAPPPPPPSPPPHRHRTARAARSREPATTLHARALSSRRALPFFALSWHTRAALSCCGSGTGTPTVVVAALPHSGRTRRRRSCCSRACTTARSRCGSACTTGTAPWSWR